MRIWLANKIHISWFITALCLGLIAGVALSKILNLFYFYGIEWLLVAFALAFIGAIKKYRIFLLLWLVAGILVGLSLGSNENIKLARNNKFIGQGQQTIIGKITEDPTLSSESEIRISINTVRIDQQDFYGKIWISLTNNAELKRGDIVTVKGQVSEGFGSFAASMHRSEIVRVERQNMARYSLSVRDWFISIVRSAIPEPEASLAIGYLVGAKSVLPEDLNAQLRLLGLTHVIVASGYHLTILIKLVRRIFEKISRFQTLFAGFLLIAGFISITGFSPSMTRAGLVSGLALLAWYYGRSFNPITLILLVAAATLTLMPNYLSGDLGWYLSFTAFVGVAILAPLINSYFWAKDQKRHTLRDILVTTTSAQILTFPIIAYTFGQYSPLGLISNLIVLPLVPLAMLLTFVAGVFSIVLPGLSTFFGLPAFIILKFNTLCTDVLASLPWANGEIEFGTIALVASYIVILLLVIFLKIKTRHRFSSNDII